ncbi:CvpA family protein [Phaeobacter inhibens]|uniref:Colicin V production protein-like protein n=2 Tax=Phaeobacter TaxID=302485 RepID=A0AAC9ZAA3_9RHOB|nr:MULTISPECIES: CvpA family protein [Phaeobacter]AFO87077.1 colicin V production protein-like protein [Phaeobacter inhibens 2.10]AFO90802.1 colicin V production protein-like protein [Phaeobacter inhibens DSM 17395]AHD10154.1 putative membrane protein, required for colicin V production [Phaeobacter gallaeciensis DSM 26640]APX17413.1 colicin V production CvpA [Phaeobacter inhibens]ATE93418.1 colicin V production protein-like protein [Phaeobacter gallaeciensis]
MEGFTIIDGVVALVIVVSALLAYSRGFVREAMAIAGWIAAAILAFLFAPQVEPLMAEIPVIGEFIADSCELSIIAAFAAVFALALIVVSFFTPLFSSLVQRSALGGLDQGIGFFFGVLRGILLVAIAFFLYNVVMTGQSFTMVDESRSAVVFERMIGKIEDRNPEQALGWVTTQYESLIGSCEK